MPEMRDQMSTSEYLRGRGCICPVCRHNGGLEGTGVEIDNGSATQEVTCNGCGAEWTDVYTLVGYLLRGAASVSPGKDEADQ